MSVLSTAADPSAAVLSAALINEGLDPGIRVTIDDQAQATATVCFAEWAAAYTHVRLDGSGRRLRLASWRLSRID